jgi:O-antigen ligase
MIVSPRAIPAPSSPTPARPVDREWLQAKNNPLRRIGFYFALAFVFFRFSMLHELLTVKLGFNTYILYLIGPPALFLLVMTGGIRRTLRNATGWYWLLFTLWMIICTPFSFWRGGSMALTLSYIRTEIPILFLVAGLTVTLAECYQVVTVISIAAVFNVYMAKSFSEYDIAGRFNIAFSSIANANDMAAHLLLVLPILAYHVFKAKQLMIWRVLGLGVLVTGIYLILGTGSRGALVSLLVMMLVFVWKGGWAQRLVVVMGFPLVFLLLFPLLPQTTVDRLMSLFNEQESSEAQGSREQRMNLLTRSITHTITHPVFGVGPGQFLDYDSMQSISNFKRGSWQVSHNAYTQISSEMGLPGFFFMMGGTLGTFLILHKMSKRLHLARDSLAVRQLRSMVTVILVAQVSFCVSIFFLSLGYRFYLPFLSGFAIALQAAIEAELPGLERAAETGRSRPDAAPQPALPAAVPGTPA